MAAWNFPARLWKLGREVEDLFKLQSNTKAALAGIEDRCAPSKTA